MGEQSSSGIAVHFERALKEGEHVYLQAYDLRLVYKGETWQVSRLAPDQEPAASVILLETDDLPAALLFLRSEMPL